MTHDRTAYLVAHAYTDPNGKMLPQIHAVRIYSESATSLSICPRDTAALNVYEARGVDYQSASDMLCFVVQTMHHFAWCRPLMSSEHMEPIDFLHLEFDKGHEAAVEVLADVLCDVLRCSAADARRYIREGAGPLVRQRTIEAINKAQRAARAWLKRDFDAQKEAT
jgi:hypothetical protein